MSRPSSSLPISEQVVGTFSPQKSLSHHQETSITSLDYSELGQFLISAGIDRSIQLYDVHKGVHHRDIQSQKYGAHTAKFAGADLNCLYASTPSNSEVDHQIRYLLLVNKTYLRYFKGHKEQVTAIEVNPLSESFLSASLDRTVKLWDFRSASAEGNLDVGQPSVVAYDAQGIVFAVGKYPGPQSGGSSGKVAFYDLTLFDKGPFLEVDVKTLPGAVWNKIEFANNGKLLLILTDSPEHYVLDAFTGQLLTTLLAGPVRSPYTGDWMTFKYPSSGSSCFSPCGRFVVAGTPRSTVAFFDLTAIKTTEGGSHHVSLGDNPRQVRPWKSISTGGSVARTVAFNPKLLSFATSDNSVILWLPLAADDS